MNEEAQTLPERDKNGKFAPEIKGKLRKAILLMATEGISRPLAAKRVGMRPDNLAAAMRRPQTITLFNQTVRDIRDNAAQAAYLKINHLAETTVNERMKFDSSRWIAGVDGISPVQKVQGTHHHMHQFGGFTYDEPDTIEGAVSDTQSVDQPKQPIDKAD